MSDTLLACIFSPCGGYLVCGTQHGLMHVWKIASGDASLAPMHVTSFPAHRHALYALLFVPHASGHLLLSAAEEDIRGWAWSALLDQGSAPKPLLVLQSPRQPQRRGALGQLTDTAALAFDPLAGRLYSAAGDGNAYAWDVEAGTATASFVGAGEPLYCLALRPPHGQLLTGGEDGTVRLWDVRSSKCTQELRPDLAPLAPAESAKPAGGGKAARAGDGCGWCSCLAVDEASNWLVGGWSDGFLCSIELNTLACVACMPTAAAPQAVCFEHGSDFRFLSVGAEPALYSWNLTGA
jgi:WD40 repeat protein